MTGETSGKYVVLLRGINVGGHKKVPMAELRALLTSLGYGAVKTLLNSGNIVFTAPLVEPAKIAANISRNIEKTFGFAVGVIVRSVAEIQALVDTDPFKGIVATNDTRLYVTFLPEKSPSSLSIPHRSPEADFKILQASDTEVCSVLTLTPNRRTVDLMSILEKEFGQQITTRNWNTVKKIVTL